MSWNRARLGALAAVLCLSLVALPATAQEPIKIDADTLSGLEARSIGPAVMGGRIAAMDAIMENGRLTVYVGAASGGVWKSVNGGTTFKPIFDKHNQSIGAIAIDRSNPKTIWVGTGESWVRNSVSVGDGLYKSTDGGENWTKLGLENSERIANILLDPKKPETAVVCVTGHLWNAHPDRGVYRTTDGGKTWNKVLFVNEDTGCSWVDGTPDGQTLYAGMWQFRRQPHTFNSGGPGSGLYKSTDGGATWTKLTKGMPEGELGRIAVAVAPSQPKTVYAVIEAKKTALFRSDDEGENWMRLNDSAAITGRPFYFALLVADPKDAKRIYKPGFSLAISEDSGKTFSNIGGPVHSDLHALWINPDNTDHLLAGTDGGLYSSYDRGSTWRFNDNLPISQFYHVSYDLDRPYNVYGGLQDNSTWYGPSRATGGIQNRHWRSVFGGDGFWAFLDPTDPDYVYAEYQGGNLARINKKTLETRLIKPAPGAGEPKLRFNWNAPIHLSRTTKGTLYFGSQYLYRSRDRGDSWERISPDLTTNDPNKQKQEESGGLTVDNSDAEAHTTIFAISESPKNPNVLWVGTDDGNLQVSADSGKTWTNVAGNVSGLPKNTWVSSVEPSYFDERTAFATFDGHSTGDMKTYVFKTTDLGKTWTPLVNADVDGYAHVVKQDLKNPELFFVGTETGLFISLDGGKQWARYKGGNFPQVAVRDLAIHPRENDLIIGTHGRGIWIMDDITPLRALTQQVLSAEAAFLPSRESEQSIPAEEFNFSGSAAFSGRTADQDAGITYYLKKRHLFGDLRIEVYDPAGNLVSSVPGGKRRGLNRVTWSMRMKAPKVPPAAALVPNFFSFVGPRVLPGEYTVKMVKGKETFTTKLNLVPDARSKHTPEDRKLQHDTAMKLYNMLGQLTYTVDTLTDVRNQLQERAGKLNGKDPAKKQAEALVANLEKVRAKFVATREGGGITGEEKLREKLGDLYGNVNGYEGSPTQSQVNSVSALAKDFDAVVAEYNGLTSKQLPALNAAFAKSKLEAVKPMTREEWEKKQQ